ncbi:putative RNA helicase [Endocarpon pusillum]|uniref:RNA helicase n=1 Tax=Endocarpon pusillum TaxID=364733 RepID=A0A8H7ASR8_9EURO|nr:putative RNA helicase [Endocarpon pusillum]
MAPGWTSVRLSRSRSSSPASQYEDDVLLPSSKRRRLLTDSVDSDRPQTAYTAPSRIPDQKTHSTISTTLSVKLSSIQTVEPSFEALKVSPWLIKSLAAMQIKRPTAIQKACIPEILKGRDCIGGSRTGTGKTVAFAVPILQQWSKDPFGIYAVVLTPTRELALQIYEQFQALGAPQSLKTALVVGGTDMCPQAIALSQRPHIVVATPGRLADHILNSGQDTIAGLSRAQFVVLDEADRLLNASGPGSMLPDVETCLSALPPSTQRHTLLFTATVTPEVRALKALPRPKDRPPIFVSEINTEDNTPQALIPSSLRQTYLQVPLKQKDSFLHALLSVPSIVDLTSIIIFCNRTQTADLLHRILLALEHNVTSLHSKMPQSQRVKNLSSFRAQTCRLLVATDVAARGLDIPSTNLVINYDVPRNPDDYIHRVGRTARAGRAGTSVTFVGQRDVELVLAVEKHIGRQMSEWKEEGVNVETRVTRGRLLKDVGEARMEALRNVEGSKDVFGRRKKVLKRAQ